MSLQGRLKTFHDKGDSGQPVGIFARSVDQDWRSSKLERGWPIACAIASIEWSKVLAKPICSLSLSDKCE
jgi:hypothetical protein